MTVWTPPSMPAGGRVLAEGDAAQNTEIERQGNECKVLISDTGGTTSTTFGNTNLAVPVAANARYRAIGEMIYTAGTTGDIKFTITLPTGGSILRATLTSGPASETSNVVGSIYMGVDTALSALSAPGNASSVMYCRFVVYLTTSSTAGTATLQVAEATVDAGTATFVRSGSTFEVRRVDGV